LKGTHRRRFAFGGGVATHAGMAMIGRWLLFWIVLAGGVAAAQPVLRFSSPESRREIRAVVERQLTALRDEEWTTAYGLTAAAFRARVAPADYVRLMRRHFAVMLMLTRAEFGLLRDDGRLARVPVRVHAGDESAAYVFTLVRETRGWRVLRITVDRPGPSL
jgi:hypothetical protein